MKKVYNSMEVMKFLGGCASNLDVLNTREMILNINDFEERFHKIVFGALTTMAKQKDLFEVDSVSLDTYLSNFPEQYAVFTANRGMEWLENAKELSINSSLNHSMQMIRKFTLLRKYREIGMDISELYDVHTTELIKIEEQRVNLEKMDVKEIISHFKIKLMSIEDEYKPYDDDVYGFQAGEDIFELIEKLKVAPTWGLPYQSLYYNTIIRGMLGSKFVLVSAGTGTGKSRMMAGNQINISATEKYCNKTKQWIKNENVVPSLYISTELTKSEMQTLYLACISGIPEETIKNGNYSEEVEDRLKRAGQVLVDSPIHVEYTSNFSLTSLENTIEKYIISNGVGYVFFDYIQITPALAQELTKLFGYTPREDVMLSMLSAQLKAICNKFDIYVQSSTQINRNYKADGYLDATHIRGSMAVADKIDVGIITVRVTKADLEKVQSAIDTGFCNKIPTHCHHFYKNRGGAYVGVVVWVNMNLDNMSVEDCFVTNQDYELIGEIAPTRLG